MLDIFELHLLTVLYIRLIPNKSNRAMALIKANGGLVVPNFNSKWREVYISLREKGYIDTNFKVTKEGRYKIQLAFDQVPYHIRAKKATPGKCVNMLKEVLQGTSYHIKKGQLEKTKISNLINQIQ